MTDHTIGTGTNGTMLIRDPGVDNVEFWIQGGEDDITPEMPWSYTILGVNQGLRSFNFEAGGLNQFVASLYVGYTQTVIFHLGDTGVVGLGGPTDLSALIHRGGSPGTVRVKSGSVHKSAEAYVRVGGVWEPAETWVRVASVWMRTE